MTYGLPAKIRTDKGGENRKVARFMIEQRGLESHPVSTGLSVRNTRIERLWRDVNVKVASFYKEFFIQAKFLGVDPGNKVHRYLIQHLFVDRINEDLREFIEAWNHHPIRTAKNKSPLQMKFLAEYDHAILLAGPPDTPGTADTPDTSDSSDTADTPDTPDPPAANNNPVIDGLIDEMYAPLGVVVDHLEDLFDDEDSYNTWLAAHPPLLHAVTDHVLVGLQDKEMRKKVLYTHFLAELVSAFEDYQYINS